MDKFLTFMFQSAAFSTDSFVPNLLDFLTPTIGLVKSVFTLVDLGIKTSGM